MPPSSALHAWVLQHPFSASIVVTALCWPVCGCTTAILSGVASAAILCCLSNYSTPSANAARSLAASSSASIIDGSRRLIARIPTSAPIRAESCYICDTSWQRSFIGMTDVVVAGQPQWFCIQSMSVLGKVLEQQDGWDVSVIGNAGAPPIIVDVHYIEGGIYRCEFLIRKANDYSVSIKHKERHIRGSPFRLKVLAGDLEPSKCKLLGNGTGTAPLLPGQWVSISIASYDSLDNKRKQGGGTDRFSFLVRRIPYQSAHQPEPPEWIGHHSLTVDDRGDGSYSLSYCMEHVGIFECRIQYDDKVIQDGEFTCCVISEKEKSAIAQKLAKKKADWKVTLAEYPDTTIYLSINPAQLSLSSYRLWFWENRLYTLRMYRSSKMILDPWSTNKFQLSDPYHMQSITCFSEERASIYAHMLAFLHQKLGNMSNEFEDKRKYFVNQLREHSNTSSSQSTVSRLVIRREHLVEDAYSALRGFSDAKWRGRWEVTFAGEIGIDMGGLRREFLSLLATKLFTPAPEGTATTTTSTSTSTTTSSSSTSNAVSSMSSLATSPMSASSTSSPYSTPRNIRSSGSPGSTAPPVREDLNLFKYLCTESDAVHPNERCTRRLEWFEFAGKVFAKCLWDTALLDPCLINVRFSTSFFKQMLGLPVDCGDFARDDKEFYKNKIKYLLENDIDDLELGLTFSEEIYHGPNNSIVEVVDLKANGRNIPVLEANKTEYLLLLARFKLQSGIEAQMREFCKGFASIIPQEFIYVFDEQELELLVNGLPEISIADFRAHTRYSEYSESDKVIQWFWAAVENLTPNEGGKLLQFITGSSRVPAQGFAAYQPPITLCRGHNRGSLPCSHTCFNRLDLPQYDSYADFQRKLLIAINYGAEGFGLV